MSKVRKLHPEIYDQNTYINTCSGKSPLRRNPYNQATTIHKSPIRSRTPNKPLSPAKAYHQMPTNIRYIANVSPLKEHSTEVQNYIQLSNGKNLRYINGNKVERNYETCKKNDFNKHSDRVFQEQNRLFGKLVDKLNSEKKGGPRSNQSSHKTSLFAENSDIKPCRVDPSLRPSGTFKQLISQVKTGETRSQIKPHSKGKQFQDANQAETENLSCIVYRVKNPKPEQDIQMIQRQNNTPILNHYSTVVRRKPSRTQNLPQHREPHLINHQTLIEEDEDQYKELNILLGKIQDAKFKENAHANQDYLVKMSMNVQGSLQMDPFL